MKRVTALLGVATALSACGGSSRRSAASGCKGLPTARHSAGSSLGGLLPGPGGGDVASGSFDPTTVAQACRRLGAPERITYKAGGAVIWHYGAGWVTFRGQRIVTMDNGYGDEVGIIYPKK